jgi:signal transduction histidine kinase
MPFPTNEEKETSLLAVMEESLPPTCRILKRPRMLFRPFGKEEDGTTIRDISGMSIKANVEYLEEVIARTHGAEAGRAAVETLARRLNERMPDRAYQVTPQILKNPWTGYSNEFVAYLVEFCIDQSQDPDFQLNMGRAKLIAPIIQTLMRPFPIKHIYRMAAYWVQFYNKSSYRLETIEIAEDHAVMRMTLTDRAERQFGLYRRACGRIWCNALKIGIIMVPPMVHHAPEAVVEDRCCIAEGDPYCEWMVRWTHDERGGYLTQLSHRWARHILRRELEARENIISEQLQSLETRHEELHKAYVEQQQFAIDLQRKVDQLTTLYETGLAFTSILDQEKLINHSLELIIRILPFDRASLSFYDPVRKVAHDAHLVGVLPEVAAYARSLEVPIQDPDLLESQVLHHGIPVLINDIGTAIRRLHPLNQELARKTQVKAFIAVPLKVKNTIIGSLTVDRMETGPLTKGDQDVLVTLANQLAIAIDNAHAYEQIEGLNASLEDKILARTMELRQANEKLQEVDRMKSRFLSHVSHDFRTPLAAVKSLTENLLDQLPGPLQDRQIMYLSRIKANTDRLTQMINDVLDLSRLQEGNMHLHSRPVSLLPLIHEIVDQLNILLQQKSGRIEIKSPDSNPVVWGDSDRISQIIANLLDNAIKYTPEGGIIRIHVQHGNIHTVELSIKDSGPGIPEKEIPKLFDPFFQVAPGSSIGRRGLGLGLAIVKYLVELHKGQIDVQSAVGMGTEFRMRLPVCPPNPPQ